MKSYLEAVTLFFLNGIVGFSYSGSQVGWNVPVSLLEQNIISDEKNWIRNFNRREIEKFNNKTLCFIQSQVHLITGQTLLGLERVLSFLGTIPPGKDTKGMRYRLNKRRKSVHITQHLLRY